MSHATVKRRSWNRRTSFHAKKALSGVASGKCPALSRDAALSFRQVGPILWTSLTRLGSSKAVPLVVHSREIATSRPMPEERRLLVSRPLREPPARDCRLGYRG